MAGVAGAPRGPRAGACSQGSAVARRRGRPRLGRPAFSGARGLRGAGVFLSSSAERRRTDPAGPRVPPAPRARSRRSPSAGAGPPDRRLGLTPALGFHAPLMGRPRPNWFGICNFRGAGTEWGRALGPAGTPEQLPRERAARPRGSQGSELGASAPGAGAAFPARAQRSCQGAAQTLLGRAGLGRGPRGFWAQGASQGATSEAGAAGAAGAAVRTPTLRPQVLPTGLSGRARPPTPPPTWEPAAPKAWGRCGVEGLCLVSVFHPATTILSHCPPRRGPNLPCPEPARPPTPAPRACLPAGPRRRRALEREGPQGPGHCSKGQKMETVRKESPNPAGPEAHQLT